MSAPALAAPSGITLPSDAVEVLPPGAPRDVWLAERRRSIGGSDASTLLDLNPYSSRMSLFLDKTGRLSELIPNSAMEWGILLEPVVREWFSRTYQVPVVVTGMWRRPDHPRLHANPDGALVLDEDGAPVAGLEVKTSSWRLADEWRDGQCPDHAELQAQLCMWVTGLPVWWVVGLIDGRDPQVRKVHADTELQTTIVDAAETFWRVHVEPDDAPALDGSTATLDAVRDAMRHVADGKRIPVTDELLDLFEALDQARAAVKDAEAVEREAHAALQLALGDAAVLVRDLHGPVDDTKAGKANVLATFERNGTFSGKRLAEAAPDVAARYTHDVPALDTSALKVGAPEVYREHCARVIRPRKALRDLLADRPILDLGRTA